MLSSIVLACFALRALIALRSVTALRARCPSCDGQGDAPGVYSRHNPTGLVHCRACDGAGEVDHSHWDGELIVARRAARMATPATHSAAAAFEGRMARIAVATRAARLAPSLSLNVIDAARELGVLLDPTTDMRLAGWLLAVKIMALPASHFGDRYERSAAVGLALALDVGDVARAEERALWIVRPAVAMDAALRFIRRSAGRVECCACKRLVRSVDAEHLCVGCATEMREVADARARADLAWLDSAAPWSHAWDTVDALSAVA